MKNCSCVTIRLCRSAESGWKYDRKLMGDSAKHLWAWLDFWHAFNGLVMLKYAGMVNSITRWWKSETSKYGHASFWYNANREGSHAVPLTYPRIAGPRSHKFSLMGGSLTYRHSLIGAIWPSKPYTPIHMMIPLLSKYPLICLVSNDTSAKQVSYVQPLMRTANGDWTSIRIWVWERKWIR